MPFFTKLSHFLAVGLGLLLTLTIYQYLNPKTVDKIVIREIPVALSPHLLDSLKLGFAAEFQATLRPIILPGKMADSAQIKPLINEIIALKEQLKGKAKIELVYETDSLGIYRDTLKVRADFVAEKIEVEFHPTTRMFVVTVADTIPIPQPSQFWNTVEKVGYFTAGVGVGILVEKVIK